MVRDIKTLHSPEIEMEVSSKSGDEWIQEFGFSGDDLNEAKEFRAADMLRIIHSIKADIQVRVKPY